MCRLMAYQGSPVTLDTLLYQPRHSLIKQSYDAREIEEPLNGDGFGVGWYQQHLTPEPAVFVSIFPAWSNRNLKSMAPIIRSSSFFAHVRAASFGDISEANCHPFKFNNYLMMHNGSIEGFDAIKRTLRTRLSNELYSWIKGQTDSEHYFALLMQNLPQTNQALHVEELSDAVSKTILELENLKESMGIVLPTYLNTVVSDGRVMVGTRYLSRSTDEPLSLYWSEGSRYVCEAGVCRMEPMDAAHHSVLIVSEKLTARTVDWHKVPPQHMVMVDQDQKVTLKPIPLP